MNMLLNSEEGKQSNMQIKKKRRLHNNLMEGGGVDCSMQGDKGFITDTDYLHCTEEYT